MLARLGFGEIRDAFLYALAIFAMYLGFAGVVYYSIFATEVHELVRLLISVPTILMSEMGIVVYIWVWRRMNLELIPRILLLLVPVVPIAAFLVLNTWAFLIASVISIYVGYMLIKNLQQVAQNP